LAVIDIVLISIAYILPVLAHRAAFPLYRLEPVRAVVLVGLLWTANRKNAVLLALTVPLFTFWLAGHPVMPKGLLIAAELLVNVLFFVWMERKVRSLFLCMLFSILVSKAVYYLLKWLLVSSLLPAQPLVGTGLGVQLAVAVGMSLCFALLAERRRKE
jgi:hypothetical protein